MIITPRKLSGKITAPPSKSMAHRAIICAALAQGECRVTNIELSDDMIVTINAMRTFGAQVDIVDDGNRKKLIIHGIGNRKITKKPDIDCNESGSSLRFLIPMALDIAHGARFTGKGHLPERPLGTYKKMFSQKGIEWKQGEKSLPLEISGELKSGLYELAGDVSSQYITGLLFALPRLAGDSQIKITGKFESRQYVDLTLQMLKRYGVSIEKTEDGFFVPGGQEYKPADYQVEGDWSQSAFLILEGMFGDGVNISGLKADSLQGDSAIVSILQKMGADIAWQGGVLEARESSLAPLDVDVSQCPDLAPAIAAAMSVAHGKSTIFGGARLKVKESDRIMSVANALNGLGADVTPTDDGMIINGKNKLSGGSADAPNDHRIAMMVGAISSKCMGEIKLSGSRNVNKSYPSFWEDFVLMGGKIK